MMMPILLMTLVHLAVIRMSNAQINCADNEQNNIFCAFNDPTVTVEHVVKPRDSSATITFPTEPWRGCGLRNVGGIGIRSTNTSASVSVRTHLFHFSVESMRIA